MNNKMHECLFDTLAVYRELNADGRLNIAPGTVANVLDAVVRIIKRDPEPDSHDSDCAAHNMPAYQNGECNCSIAKPNDYHLSEIYKIRAQIEPLLKLIDHHTECHAEQVAAENVQIREAEEIRIRDMEKLRERMFGVDN